MGRGTDAAVRGSMAMAACAALALSACATRTAGVEQRLILPEGQARYEMAAHQAFVFPRALDQATPAFPPEGMPKALPPTTLTFVPGQYMQSVSTTVLTDNVAEAGIAETVNLIITQVSSGIVPTATAGVVILEDEGLLWSISSVTAQAEGNSGSSGKIVVQVGRDTRSDQLQMTDTVVVSSPHMKAPMTVRYAFTNDPQPEANLYNGAGLPASPFRTDDWP